jgi:ABC-type transport system involved in cytochrome c biogenesis permease subunit
MYESIIYMGFGTSLIGLILELRRPQKLVLAASSAISAAVLLLADSFPTVLDPGFRPLPPALRNDFWLVIHVLTVTFSYSAFAVALGIGNITLGYFLVRSRDGDIIAMLGRLNYRCIQVGVLFLAVGTVTGGIWADYSWGRFWGWDPKEVWALITLLGYLAVLHSRYVNWVGQFGMAALSVICFSLVVITWYGVNFLLGSGLHNYGGGSGGRLIVGIWLFVQFCYVAVAAARSAGHSANLPAKAGSRLL